MQTVSETVADAVNLDDLDWWTRPAAERDAVFTYWRAHNPRPYFPEIDSWRWGLVPGDETSRKALCRVAEVSTKREHASVDAWLYFALEESLPAGIRRTQIPAPAVIVPPQARFEAQHC